LDIVDLYQMRPVGYMGELEEIMGGNETLQAFKEAMETGLIGHIGIMGHKDMRVHCEALERFDFDSVLLSVCLTNMVALCRRMIFDPCSERRRTRMWRSSRLRPLQGDAGKGGRRYSTWYEPIDEPRIESALRPTLSQEPVATHSLPCDFKLWPLVLEAAENFRRLDSD